MDEWDEDGDDIIHLNWLNRRHYEPYFTLFDAIDYNKNYDRKLTVDEMAAFYLLANIHEKGTIPDCFTGSNGEKICIGDKIGDLQSVAGGELSDMRAKELA